MIDVRKGRPRDGRIDRDVTAAALDLLADVGFERFSVEEVAARAGVAKTTIYRRFPTRIDLLAGALERLNDDVTMPPADWSTHDRLVAMLTFVRKRKSDASSPDHVLHVAASSCRDPELLEIIQQRVVGPRRLALRTALEDGITSGQLRADLDVDAAVAILVGSMFYLGLADQRGESALPTVEATVRCALAGLAPAG